MEKKKSQVLSYPAWYGMCPSDEEKTKAQRNPGCGVNTWRTGKAICHMLAGIGVSWAACPFLYSDSGDSYLQSS